MSPQEELKEISRIDDLQGVTAHDEIAWEQSPLIGRYVVVSDVSPCCKVKMRVLPAHQIQLRFKVQCLHCGATVQQPHIRPGVELTSLPGKARGMDVVPGGDGEPDVVEERPPELRG
jgi:hypothetical protein